MTQLVEASRSNSLGAAKQMQLKGLVVLEEYQMVTYSDLLPNSSTITACQIFQCQKCKGVHLRSSFFKSNFGTSTSLKRFLGEQSSHQNFETS